RGGRPPRPRDRLGALTRARAPRARRIGREDVPRAQEARAALRRLRHAACAGRLRRAHDLLLPAVPDRRAAAQGPPALEAPPLARRARTKFHFRHIFRLTPTASDAGLCQGLSETKAEQFAHSAGLSVVDDL